MTPRRESLVGLAYEVFCFAVVGTACVIYFVPFMVADIIKNWRPRR